MLRIGILNKYVYSCARIWIFGVREKSPDKEFRSLFVLLAVFFILLVFVDGPHCYCHSRARFVSRNVFYRGSFVCRMEP